MNTEDAFILRCPGCRTKNRVPRSRIGDVPRCGKCGGTIPTAGLFSGKPIIVTDSDFDSTVMNCPLPVCLDCWAPWCGPCQMIGPIMEDLAKTWIGKAVVCKLNTDENPVISGRYQIMSIPTILIIEAGQIRDTIAGAAPKQMIIQKMTPFIQ